MPAQLPQIETKSARAEELEQRLRQAMLNPLCMFQSDLHAGWGRLRGPKAEIAVLCCSCVRWMNHEPSRRHDLAS